MRCNDCGKFVSYDEGTVEVQSVDLEGTQLTAEVRVALPCAECGTELKETILTLEAEVTHLCQNLPAEAGAPEYTITEEPDSGEFTERGDGKGLIQAAGTGRVRDPRKRPTQVGTTWFHPDNVALASSGAAPQLRAGERITELGAAPRKWCDSGSSPCCGRRQERDPASG